MKKSKVFVRTESGDEQLEVEYGNLGGDARRLLAIIDGKTSVAGIAKKVPYSVQVQLDAIFAKLLSKRLIAEKPRAVGDLTSGASGDGANDMSGQTAKLSKPAEQDSERRIELEQELADVRAQLAASKSRQQEVEAVCRRLQLQFAVFDQGKLANLTEPVRRLPGQIGSGADLHDSLDNLSKLNQELLDQQEILDGSLMLRNYQMQLSGKQGPVHSDAEGDKIRNHPLYKRLRGLEFFKGFANDELLRFLALVEWQRVKAGETIFNEGDVGMTFFIIVSGSVRVIRKAHMLASLSGGDFFGEYAYLSGGEPSRSAQVQAATDCDMLVVDPLQVEFSSVQLRLHLVEALLRGQVKRALLSSQRIDNLLTHLDIPVDNEPE